jgi:preprotein translocase subunit YajC
VWFGLIAAMFFVFIVRPQRRKLAEFEAMQGTVEVGDEILTTSGLFGTVVALDDESFSLEIASGTVVRFARQAIGRILSDDARSAAEAPVDRAPADEIGSASDPTSLPTTNEVPGP